MTPGVSITHVFETHLHRKGELLLMTCRAPAELETARSTDAGDAPPHRLRTHRTAPRQHLDEGAAWT